MTASSPATPPHSGDSFRTGALAGVLAALIVIGLFLPTARDMAWIWWRSETFAHGMVVMPISLWLIWRLRHRLSALPLRPAPGALGALLLAALAWALGETAGVAALSHAALAGMVIAAVWAIWGNALARAAMFPLGFLLFCVPVGEFLVPTLMHYTADFAVTAVRASGVPVYREGLSFVIPSGRWSVVEACSGIRYLIASVMVGFLFAYLNYRSLMRRALFVAASVVVPLVANWFRAYLIVMVGHLSGNKLATGVDHLIYGWVFFGIVILGLFWVGSLWREDDAPLPAYAAQQAAENANQGVWRRVLPFLFAIAVVAGVWIPVQRWLVDIPPAKAYVLDAPAAAPGWVQVGGEPAFGWQPHYVGERARRVQSYQQGSETVTLFMAYYAREAPGRKLIQWDNRLVFAEDKVWMQLADTTDTLAGAVPARRAELKSEAGRLAVWSWLWLNPTRTSDLRQAKIDLVTRRLARRPDDSAAVIVYTPEGEDPVVARQRVDAFVRAHLSAIEASLAAAPRN